MISFGPATGIDTLPDAALPPQGGDAAPAGALANAFDSMLSQFMGKGNITAGDADDDPADLDAASGDDDDAADPSELVNTLVVGGVPAPITLTMPVVTDVTPAGSTGVQMLLDASHTTDAPGSDVSLLKDLLANAKAVDASDKTPDATGDAATPTAATKANDPQLQVLKAAIERTQAETPVDASTPAQTKETQTAPAAASTPAAKSESGKTSRIDRPKSAPKGTQAVESMPAKAVPAHAVERAYASRDRESSRSFEGSRDSAPAPRLQAIGQAVATTPFVVPADAGQLKNVPAPAMLLAAQPGAVIDAALDAHLPTQIVQSIRMQAIDGGGEATIRLNPDYLGEVVVAVKVEQGGVSAALQSDTPSVRQWVERNEQVLRQALAEHGLQLDRLSVSEAPAESELDRDADPQAPPQDQESRQQSRRRRPRDGDATFEVTV